MRGPMSLQAEIIEHQNCLVVSGTLNFATVASLWNASLPLLEKQPSLQFDLSKIISANSAGLTLLLEWIRYAREKGKSICFQNMPSQLLSIATVAGVNKILT